MTPITQAPLVEYVLTKAPDDDAFGGLSCGCEGCAHHLGGGVVTCRPDDFSCISNGAWIYAVVPAGFSEPSEIELAMAAAWQKGGEA